MSGGLTTRWASAGDSLLPRHFFTGLEETNRTSSSGFLLIGKEAVPSLQAIPESTLGMGALLWQSMVPLGEVLRSQVSKISYSSCRDGVFKKQSNLQDKWIAETCSRGGIKPWNQALKSDSLFIMFLSILKHLRDFPTVAHLVTGQAIPCPCVALNLEESAGVDKEKTGLDNAHL